ncbi:MAG: thiamine-phosphate kinase [Planctomycetota bacterium]
MGGDELQFVEWLRGRQPRHSAVVVGIGDDMAVLTATSDRILVSSDMLLDGVHFDTGRHSLFAIGRKAIACSLSDCAAMAVRPIAATVSVALPGSLPLAGAEELYRGMFSMAEEFDLAVAGGDTTRWPHPLVIDVAVTATPYPGIDPVLRSGARPGDLLYVTGTLGGSLLDHHLTFHPRVREAVALSRKLGKRLHAMIDISDGLSLDLWRLCTESKAGAELDERQLQAVVSDDAMRAASADGRTALDHALSDGEDFELLLAVEGDATGVGIPVYPIGRITPSGLTIVREDGRVEPLEPRGYVH